MFKDIISEVVGQLATGSQQVRIKWLVTVNGHNILMWDRMLIVTLTLTLYPTDRLAERCDQNIPMFHDVFLNFGDRVTFLVNGSQTKNAVKVNGYFNHTKSQQHSIRSRSILCIKIVGTVRNTVDRSEWRRIWIFTQKVNATTARNAPPQSILIQRTVNWWNCDHYVMTAAHIIASPPLSTLSVSNFDSIYFLNQHFQVSISILFSI